MHFCIAILGNNPEEIIEKYSENLSGIFLKTKEHIIAEKRAYNSWYKKSYYDVYVSDKEEYKRKNPTARQEHFDHVENFINIYNMTDDEILKEEYDYISEDNSGGKSDCGGIYMSYNPIGKWDWYQVGGRWVNSLIVKEKGIGCVNGEGSLLFAEEEKKRIESEKQSGLFCDSALIRDIDWENEKMKEFFPYGMVLENGDWYDKDYCVIDGKYRTKMEDNDMEEFFTQMIRQAPDSTRVTIIDIHS